MAYRKSLMKYTEKYGVSRASRKYNKSRSYIYFWKQRWDGIRSLPSLGRIWQNAERLRLGEYYQDRGYLFAQDTGGPMHPDSVTDWLAKFM